METVSGQKSVTPKNFFINFENGDEYATMCQEVIKMTKDAVLSILRNENGYVSGAKMSVLLGVSRAAIHKAVRSLMAEGYDILSSTNKGYYLNAVPDRLTVNELSVYLDKHRMESVLCVDSVDSTNNKLRKLALEGAPDGQIVVANEQRHGRGRRGRSFLSLKDKGIYLSMLVRPEGLPADMIEITSWTAVAVHKAIQTVCGISTGIKWVNDLVIDQRKVCGILTEMSVESESGYVQYVLIGIGINVNEKKEDFPEDLQRIATSLSMETGREYLRAQLAAEVIKELDRMRDVWPGDKQSYLKVYKANSIVIGKEIIVVKGSDEKPGTAISVNDDFSLTVRYKDETLETLSSGEISIRGCCRVAESSRP